MTVKIQLSNVEHLPSFDFTVGQEASTAENCNHHRHSDQNGSGQAKGARGALCWLQLGRFESCADFLDNLARRGT